MRTRTPHPKNWQAGEFGNRHWGRFPRIAATIDGGGYMWLSNCRNRHTYNHGQPQAMYLDVREAERIAAVIREALPYMRREAKAAEKRRRKMRKENRLP